MKSGGTCIVTGGAGFIGCATSAAFADRFDRVVAVDVMHPQIHRERTRPKDLDPRVEFRVDDICEPSVWDDLLSKVGAVDTVVHLAAETGTAQSLEESTRHGMTNVVGTTVMLDAFARHRQYPRQILLSSSRAVYGEGGWQHEDGLVFYPGQRTDGQLSRKEWDFPGARPLPCEAGVTVPNPTSVYGATKLAQEHILSAWGQSFSVMIKILRLQNVYGPGQSLINAYTGIVPLFVRLAKQGRSIPLYEDGAIIRDFVYIDDVADAFARAADHGAPILPALDIGTGTKTTISEIASIIADHYGAPKPQVCHRYRNGDVRSASCRIDRAFSLLGYIPRWTLEEGIGRLGAWIDDAEP